jgi:hypothetical protein
MPIHNWTRVDAGIFHDFHHSWIAEIKRVLNSGVLPEDYYALAEQIAGGLGPDVLTRQRPTNGAAALDDPRGGVTLATAPPVVLYRARAEVDVYATKAKALVIGHKSNHQVIAVVEVVSPGNKNSRHGLRGFVTRTEEMLRGGVHLLVVDLFPPGPRDPQGIHKAIWDEFIDNDFALPSDKPLTLAAYIGGPCPEAFVEPTAVGRTLVNMPLFLTPDVYVPLPLEPTYQAAWATVPSFWRQVLEAPLAP